MKAVLLLAAILGCACALAFAWLPVPGSQERNGAHAPATSLAESSIAVGQSLDDALAVLSAAKIEHYEGKFSKAYVLGPDDDPNEVELLIKDRSNVTFELDENHTTACVHYSTSERAVTDIELLIVPYRRATKLNHTWLRATELRLHGDRSFTVRFSRPPTEEEREQHRRRMAFFQLVPPFDQD